MFTQEEKEFIKQTLLNTPFTGNALNLTKVLQLVGSIIQKLDEISPNTEYNEDKEKAP